MKILLAIDESPCAEVAVREVEERFTMRDTTVRVLHIVEKFVPPAATLWYDGGGNPKAAHAKVVDHYQRFVDRIAERLTSRGISIETVVNINSVSSLAIAFILGGACWLALGGVRCKSRIRFCRCLDDHRRCRHTNHATPCLSIAYSGFFLIKLCS